MIKIELNGCRIDVRIDVNSLRAALGLPLHDIFANGIFHEYVHNETTGPDVEDTDHGAVQPPAAAPPPPPPPSPPPPIAPPSPSTPTLPADARDNNSDTISNIRNEPI